MAKDTLTAQTPTVEEQLQAAQARNAELAAQLEATKRPSVTAPAAVPPAQSAALAADLAAGQAIAAEWLGKGCPICKAPIKTDTPVFQPTLPALYPAILFHYGVVHEGVTPPAAPHAADEQALDTVVIKGIMLNGTPRWIPYRQAISEAVAEWKLGVR